MMFYTTVGGWMISYFFKMISGDFQGITPTQVADIFSQSLHDPFLQIFWMIIVVLLAFGICSLGLQNGVEKMFPAPSRDGKEISYEENGTTYYTGEKTQTYQAYGYSIAVHIPEVCTFTG